MSALRPFTSFPFKSLMFFATVLTMAQVSLAPTAAFAEPPKVVASIKPVQALVKAVMGDLGDPALVIPATASPHMFSLKPSQAKTLEEAQVVFWIGPQLETALVGPMEQLAASAQVVELLKTPRLRLLNYDTESSEPDQDHTGIDPHIWLSPSNARVLVRHIAEVLSQIDPANADVYAHNADQARQQFGILSRKTMQYVAAMRYVPYLVQHDGYGYLALEFGFNEVGHIQVTPGREPGAKHVAEIIDLIKSKEVKCLLHEPQFPPKMAQRLHAETGIALSEVDPLGTHLPLSETTYVRIIQDIISSMETCLQPRPMDKPPTAE